jgi:hypothetical protein
MINYIIDIKVFNTEIIDRVNSTGSPKIPHYRRGHIRRLPNKVVFVKPAFINAEKEFEIDKKIYRLNI